MATNSTQQPQLVKNMFTPQFYGVQQQPQPSLTTFTHQPPLMFQNAQATSIIIPNAQQQQPVNHYNYQNVQIPQQRSNNTTPGSPREEDFDEDEEDLEDYDDEDLDDEDLDERRKRKLGQSSQSRRTGPVRRSKKGGWTEEEDMALRDAVNTHGGKNWKKIAEMLTNRTSVQCLHRWQKVLNPNLVKGPWTKDEDDTILKLVQTYGAENWSMIASHLPGRIGKQCRERWYNHLNPAIKKEPWSEEEEKILLETQESMGNKWAEISKMLPGRTDNACKNHFNSLVARRKKGSAKPQRKPRRSRRDEIVRGHARSLSDSVFYQFNEQQQAQMSASTSMLQLNTNSYTNPSPVPQSPNSIGFNNLNIGRQPVPQMYMYGVQPPPLQIPTSNQPRMVLSVPSPQQQHQQQYISQASTIRSAPTPTSIQQHFIPITDYGQQYMYQQPPQAPTPVVPQEQTIDSDFGPEIMVSGSPFDLLANEQSYDNDFKLELNIQDVQNTYQNTFDIAIKQEPDDLDLIAGDVSIEAAPQNTFDNGSMDFIPDEQSFFFDELLIKNENNATDQVSGGVRKKKFKHAHHNRSISFDVSLLNNNGRKNMEFFQF